VLLRAGLGLLAMLCSFAGGALGSATDSEWGPFLGAVAGLVLGLALAVLLYRRLTRSPA
jgi:nitrate reductase gamma subunit